MKPCSLVPWKRIPFRLAGILLLAYLLYVTDLPVVLILLRNITPSSMFAAVGAFIVLVLARCWRWQTLVSCVGVSTPAVDNFLSCNTSIWLGLVTPGRVGELGRGIDLARQSGKGLAETSALVFFDLLFDLFAYTALALGGALVITLGDNSVSQAINAACIGVGFLTLLYMRIPIAAGIRWLPWVNKIPGVSLLLPSLVSNLGLAKTWRISVATALASLALVLMVEALTSSLHLPLGLTETMAMVGLVGVSGAIPITYFGLGTRDITLIWYLGQHGQSLETAVAVSFMFLLAQLIGIATSITLGFAVGCSAKMIRD